MIKKISSFKKYRNQFYCRYVKNILNQMIQKMKMIDLFLFMMIQLKLHKNEKTIRKLHSHHYTLKII